MEQFSQENFFNCKFPLLTYNFLRFKSFNSRFKQEIKLLLEFKLKYIPASPATSGNELVLGKITGHWQAIASNIGIPKPSYFEGNTNAKAL
jgi:hypothetical protein